METLLKCRFRGPRPRISDSVDRGGAQSWISYMYPGGGKHWDPCSGYYLGNVKGPEDSRRFYFSYLSVANETLMVICLETWKFVILKSNEAYLILFFQEQAWKHVSPILVSAECTPDFSKSCFHRFACRISCIRETSFSASLDSLYIVAKQKLF